MHHLIMGSGIFYHKNEDKSDNRKQNLMPARGFKNQGKTILNGYIAIYYPEHPRAFDKNGCVYEHILVAEEILQRPLHKEECVHHKDYNRMNNAIDNLMVFQSNQDHIAFHAGAQAILSEDKTYYCIKSFQKIIYCYNNRTKKEIDNQIKDQGSVIILKTEVNKDICPACNKNLKDKKPNNVENVIIAQ